MGDSGRCDELLVCKLCLGERKVFSPGMIGSAEKKCPKCKGSGLEEAVQIKKEIDSYHIEYNEKIRSKRGRKRKDKSILSELV
jgi:hypothetical protein